MSAILDAIFRKNGTDKEDAMIHIYDDSDPNTSLCGIELDGHGDLPWHRGIYDCSQCWAIHDLERAGEI